MLKKSIVLILATCTLSLHASTAVMSQTDDLTRFFNALSKTKNIRMITPAALATIGLAAIFYRTTNHNSESFLDYANNGMYEQTGSNIGLFLYDVLHSESEGSAYPDETQSPDVNSIGGYKDTNNDYTDGFSHGEDYYDSGVGSSWETGDHPLFKMAETLDATLESLTPSQARVVLEDISKLEGQFRCGGYRPIGCRVIETLREAIEVKFNL